jgi:hypothetical protein
VQGKLLRGEIVNKERLLILASYLEDKVQDKYFDFRYYVGKGFKGSPDLSCGTTACGMGHATQIPEFQEAGLKLKAFQYADKTWEVTIAYKGSLTSSEAGAIFFDVSMVEYSHLFIPNNNTRGDLPETATRLDLVNHIRKFVEENEDGE